jgi:hypothetical protein
MCSGIAGDRGENRAADDPLTHHTRYARVARPMPTEIHLTLDIGRVIAAYDPERLLNGWRKALSLMHRLLRPPVI